MTASISPSTEDPDEEVLRACLAASSREDRGYGPAAAAAAAEAMSCGHVADGLPAGAGGKGPGNVAVDKTSEDGDGEDIIGKMIEVFGSVDVFIQEYRWVMHLGARELLLRLGGVPVV